MKWQFTLKHKNNTIKVTEPVDFDSVDFSLKRDLKTHGVVFEFSTVCAFYKEAKNFILDIFNTENINAEIQIYIAYFDFNQQKFIQFYKGLLGLRDIQYDSTFVKLRIEQDSFLRKFNSKKDLDVSLKPNLQNVKLHSKVIRQVNSWIYDSQFTSIELTNNISQSLKRNGFIFPLQNKKTELQNLNQITSFTSNNIENTNNPPNGDRQVPNHYIQFQFSGQIKIKYRFRGRFTFFNNIPTSASANIFLQCFVANEFYFNAANNQWTSGTLQTITVGVSKYFDFDLQNEIIINVNEGQRLFFLFVTNINGNPTTPPDVYTKLELFEGSFFDVSQDTQGVETEHIGITIFEAFSQIVENYTGKKAKFKSDFFQFGCGANRMLSNGFWLRQLNDKEFFQNFQDLFESLQSISNFGLSIYKEGTQDIVRVEPMQYFYKNGLLNSFQYPNDLSITLAKDLYNNKINVGYEKWNNEAIGQINGLDEFNAKMQFATKIEASNFFDNEGNRTEFNFVSKLIASGYLIEWVRRQIGKDSTDTSFDNDTFIICLNENNTASEKNENFEIVENIISPETAYNLRISPKRNLLNFSELILAQMIKGNDTLKEVVFRSGEGNFKLKSKATDSCLVMNEIIENENFELLKKNAIFEAEIYEFSYPLSFVEYQKILNNPFGVIEIAFGAITFAGFILEINYNVNGGIAKFKLLKSLVNYKEGSYQFQDGQNYDFQDGQNYDFQDA